MTAGETPQVMIACTISRDIHRFDLLIEDMEDALGDSWGDLHTEEAALFLEQPEAALIEFVVLAIDDEDSGETRALLDIFASAHDRGVRVIVVAGDVSSAVSNRLMMEQPMAALPYPLPENDLAEAIAEARRTAQAARRAIPARSASAAPLELVDPAQGRLIVVQGVAGGTGSTTFAGNLAWEAATARRAGEQTVCLLDLDLQFGGVASLFNLPRLDATRDLWLNTRQLDPDVLGTATHRVHDRLAVLTAPPRMAPRDVIVPEDITRLIDVATRQADLVIVDMPKTLAPWAEILIERADDFIVMLDMNIRATQNAARFQRMLVEHRLPCDGLRFALNRAPGFTDRTGRARMKQISEQLGVGFDLRLPEGGRPVALAGETGVPLALGAPKSPLRKEILRIAAAYGAPARPSRAAA